MNALSIPFHLGAGLALAAVLVHMGVASAQPVQPDPPTVAGPELARLMKQLQAGGYVIYFRHLPTRHDQEDRQPVDLNDCAAQRNVSEEGKTMGKSMGSTFAQYRLPIEYVVSSPFCRAQDTARLLFRREPQTDADLFFAMALPDAGKKAKGMALGKMLSQLPRAGTNRAIVGHTVNLQEAAGWWPKPEGVAYVIRPDGKGGFTGVARVAPESWAAMAGK